MASDPDGDSGRLDDVRAALAERAGLQLATTENGEWIHVVDFETADARVRVRSEYRGVPLCMTYGAYNPLEADLASAEGRLCGKCVAELLDVRAAPVESTSDWDAVDDRERASDGPRAGTDTGAESDDPSAPGGDSSPSDDDSSPSDDDPPTPGDGHGGSGDAGGGSTE